MLGITCIIYIWHRYRILLNNFYHHFVLIYYFLRLRYTPQEILSKLLEVLQNTFQNKYFS